MALAHTAREKSDSNFSCSSEDIVSVNFETEVLLRGGPFFSFLGKVPCDEKSINQSASHSSEAGFCSFWLLNVLWALYFSLTSFGQQQFST